MKKLFSFMLASALCAVLMGCGDEDKSSSATTTKTEKAVEKPVKKKGDPLKDAQNDVEAMRLKDFIALVLDSGCDVSPTAAQSLGADYEFDYKFHKTTLACEGKFKKFNNQMKKFDLNKIKKNYKDHLEYLYGRVNDINKYIDENGEFGSLKDMLDKFDFRKAKVISDDEIAINDILYKLDRKNSTLIIGPITDESDEEKLMISQLNVAFYQYFIDKSTDFPLSIDGDNIVAKIDLNAKENAKKEVEAMSLKEFYKFYKNGGCDTYKEFLNHKAKIACEEKFKTYKDKLDKQIEWQKDYPFASDEWFLYNSLADINDYVIANKKFGNLEDMINTNKEEVIKRLEATNGVKMADGFLGFSKADMDSKNLTITLHSIDKNTVIEYVKSFIKQEIEKEKLKDEPNAETLKSLEENLAEYSSAEELKKFDEYFGDNLLRGVASEVAIEEGALKTIVQATTKDGKFVVKFPFDDTKAISDEAKKYANQILPIIDDIRKYYQKHKKFHTDIKKMTDGFVNTGGYDKDSFSIALSCVDGKLDRANATLTLSQSQRYGKSARCKKILADESMVNIMSENGGVYSLK
ncbi:MULTISPECIES: LptM family lipoprotein [unclassified Campylobacter]|uniref:LptM family lipoprotein n=1 Tax=unclassified Campylobacter TaxID=2593542 RepID=UPI0022E9A492|nr:MULTISPECIES: hypothetical protein [unclassified Campylobacter]MDA3079830.1 hypothetical protein [Campylobacter sp. CS_NA2]MDA3081410.1 hypothetical protein [Campylobacter sp. CS_NA1]MDA3085931.1 hypothetical protein [Campylobacter sp. CS_ED1]MDA3090664.1 hypothetical protein [Campylobacter sp. CS_ED2]WBR50562.1 hypothetical protein PF026_04170 [Campylobacter sp. CS_NA3]